MTEDEVARAGELIFARDEIEQFLSTRDPESEFVQEYLKSGYDHRVREGKRLPKMKVTSIYLIDSRSAEAASDDSGAESAGAWFLPRDVLERALKAELVRISDELIALGVTGDAP